MTETTLDDGVILPSSSAPFGFSSAIISRKEGSGNVKKLFDLIECAGFRIAAPTPFARMLHILQVRGFRPTFEHDDLMGTVEVWRKAA